MGLFGGSSSRSSSRTRSSSFDNMDASSFDVGFSSSESGSHSEGRSSGFNASDQRIAFGDVFADMFGKAGGAAGRAASGAGGVTNAANMLFTSGSDIIDQLSGGGAGAEHLEGRLADRDGLADQQIGQLGEDLARFLSEDASGAITSGGVSASTLGGSRGEVQKGIAERGAAEAFTRGATDIRLADQNARDSIAGKLMDSEAMRGGTALSALPELFGLAEGGNMAELSPLAMLSGILGPQQALTTSAGESSSSQFSDAMSKALGINLGGSSTIGRAGSTSATDSDARSKSISIG